MANNSAEESALLLLILHEFLRSSYVGATDFGDSKFFKIDEHSWTVPTLRPRRADELVIYCCVRVA